ncbi:MAG: c-type cytochrome, partial [Phycisphaerae bacterium]
VQAAHTPPTHEIEEEWADKYYVRELGITTVDFATIEHYWDRPMRLPQYSEAGCAKCHTQVTDIAYFDGHKHGKNINLGQQLFTQVGCINCHNVEQLEGARRVGPDLTHMASKLSAEFAQKWIYFPQKFRPSTRMPHFFGQENNDEAAFNEYDPHPEFRTETEVAAITQYLLAVSKTWEPIEKPADVSGDVDRGRELFTSLGCQGCHSNISLNGEEWITKDLIAREGLDNETARYRYLGMTYEDRVHYAMEHFPAELDSFLDPDSVQTDGPDGYKAPYFSRFAPELSGIGSKVDAEWLYSWLIEPTHYAPDTKMPSLRLSPQEAADVTEYLLTLKNDSFDQTPFTMTAERKTEVSDLLMTLLSAQNSKRRSQAILNDEGAELTKRLASLLATSEKYDDQSAYDLISAMTLEDKQLYFLGNQMIAHYGCYTCHEIAGFEETSPVGTDLTLWAEKPITQLDFAFFDHAFHHLREEKEDVYGYVYRPESEQLNKYSPLPDDTHEQITHTHGAFAKHKFLNPRIWDREKLKKPYDKLKMPNFYFTEREADALVTYMLSRIPPRVRGPLEIDYETTTSGPIARGRTLTRDLNCVGCHQIEDNDPMIQQYYRLVVGGEEVFDEVNAPPRLWGQGAKVQADWMHGFFGNVETLRPWLQVRMPNFKLTQQETSDLVAYFASLSEYDADKLLAAHGPVTEYIGDAERKAAASGEEVTNPGSDWYQDPLLQQEAKALRQFAMDRKLLRPREFDALSLSEERIRKAHEKLLERTEFIQGLYAIEYPFTEAPIKLSDEEYFKMGENFFVDMGCLKCHVIGEMLPGPAKNTDDFVQVYRLDAVRGEGETAMAVLNGVAYPVGSQIDGHTIISAANVYNDTGDVDTSAIIEGPNANGETEKIRLQAASAPNLNLTYKRLQRDWFEAWMLLPQLIQPGTKMPQNFVDGVSPFEGSDEYPGTGEDHIRLLTDYVYEAGVKGSRLPLPKLVVVEDEGEFDDEDGEFDEEEFD